MKVSAVVVGVVSWALSMARLVAKNRGVMVALDAIVRILRVPRSRYLLVVFRSRVQLASNQDEFDRAVNDGIESGAFTDLSGRGRTPSFRELIGHRGSLSAVGWVTLRERVRRLLRGITSGTKRRTEMEARKETATV